MKKMIYVGFCIYTFGAIFSLFSSTQPCIYRTVKAWYIQDFANTIMAIGLICSITVVGLLLYKHQNVLRKFKKLTFISIACLCIGIIIIFFNLVPSFNNISTDAAFWYFIAISFLAIAGIFLTSIVIINKLNERRSHMLNRP